jgi:hypothetical protein
MTRRSTRVFGPAQQEALLDAVRACRHACVRAVAAAPIGGPVYVAAGRLMEAIDDLAEVLTGDRRHFHGKPHSIG